MMAKHRWRCKGSEEGKEHCFTWSLIASEDAGSFACGRETMRYTHFDLLDLLYALEKNDEIRRVEKSKMQGLEMRHTM